LEKQLQLLGCYFVMLLPLVNREKALIRLRIKDLNGGESLFSPTLCLEAFKGIQFYKTTKGQYREDFLNKSRAIAWCLLADLSWIKKHKIPVVCFKDVAEQTKDIAWVCRRLPDDDMAQKQINEIKLILGE